MNFIYFSRLNNEWGEDILMKAKLSYILSILILFICIFVATNVHGKELQSNYNVKEIRVIADEDFPPYIFRDEKGHLKGIIVDQWHLWSEKTGIKVKIHGMNWKNAQKFMEEGKYDVIDTMFKNEERKRSYYFSDPYAKIEVPIFFNKNISGITDIKSLKDLNVGIKKADCNVDLLREEGIKDYLEFDTYESMIKAARNNEINAFIMGKPAAMYYMYNYHMEKDFRYTNPQYIGKFYRAVKKEDTHILNAINDGFSQISKLEYEQIHNKWFGIEYEGHKFILHIKIFTSLVLVIGCILIIWNITLKKAVKEKTLELTNTVAKLKRSENRINAIFKALPDLFFIIDKNGIFMDYEVNNLNKLKYSPKEFLGKSISQMFSEELAQKLAGPLQDTIKTGDTQIVEYLLPKEDDPLYFEARIIKYDEDVALTIIREITEKKLSDMKIYNMSIRDGMTGLYNRSYFERQMEIRNENKDLNQCVIICDLDGLKFINDTFGHATGDEYLKIATDIIKACFKNGNNVIARIGGDEFGILMEDTSEKEVLNIKSKLKDMLKEVNKNRGMPVSISFGYSISQENKNDLKEMFKEADAFMYKEKLHHKQSLKSDLFNVIMKMLETRDFIREGHCDRLEILSAKLAKAVGMTDNKIQDISLFSKFHDIGKIGVSDRVLFKTKELTEEEFEEMKRHTEIGYRIAQSCPDIAHIADWILKHHEWWNGEGYPLGLKGDEIPIECRILSIVDAYDAMTSDRPYRKALSKKEAMEELKLCSKVQFDPYLVEVFLGIL
ncbi:MAG: transporter substrate-binding domain-containing protein [Anaeromicrobium sp.]|jgi:diguanylate cyclase (GGDEF)-like protein/PAS domain S-box-containing protein|uniref:diguanylate cyclase n=1 Tax=Anaeromicrobium sp. TaxID=1929132 RepID=UPI0025D9EE6E|nr:transporter substrate-binding domain-containing protein [Anaeromicrobium sp.]MCT4595111.1 transporter substrate-binding domain-containing protein [Anaeromicrobium sp.]